MKALEVLESRSLDAICEVIGAPAEYNAGKSAMGEWFLCRIKAAIDELRTQPPQDDWKDISTAPRDGTGFLAVRLGYICWQTPDYNAPSGFDSGPDQHEATFKPGVVKAFFIAENENFIDEEGFVFRTDGKYDNSGDDDENPLRLTCWQPMPR